MSETRVKKTTLACDHCRRRKRKCDGRTPICVACERGNIECTYTANLDQRRPARKNYVAALEARIALLEQILKNAEVSDGAGSSDAGASPSECDLPQLSSETTPPSSPPVLPQTDLASALVDDTANILKYTLEPTTQLEASEELDLGMGGYETLLSLQHEHKLLAQFWDWQRMHLPYVAPVPFLSAYAIHSELVHPGETIPSPPPPPPNAFAATALNVPRASAVQLTSDLAHYISPLLLYSMFAIAALFHGDPETSTMFYQRAREMLFEESQNPKVATVQAVCLMSTWELGHARSPASWTLIGVALSLCIRLGLNVDATPLLQSGAISQRLYETRNFVFWATFNTERFHAICMGMRPLTDRRIINTPKYSSPTADPIKSKTSITPPSEMSTTWWSPSTLGMGDVLVQAAWDSIGELIQMMDNLFDNVYATEAPTRTPKEILELVTRNHLTIQKFIDSLPTWLRSTGAIRRKESGLVYLHLFIHLTSILANRPFLSVHHSAQTPLTRKYRTLAFRVARASALQVSSLIRHIPLSSPCVTMPYIVYSACTILLLAPEDGAAMDGVRTCLACLDGMDETGYWVDSAKDAAMRVRALAQRWGVGLGTSRRVLGLVGSGNIGKVQGEESEPLSAVSTCSSTSAGRASAHTSPQNPEPGLTGVPEYSIGPTGGTYVPQLDQSGFEVRGHEYSLADKDDELAGNIDELIDRSLQVLQRSQDGRSASSEVQVQLTHFTPEQTRNTTFDLTQRPNLYEHQPPSRYTLQPPTHHHPYKRNTPKRPPHVAYALSHADPEHDMRLPYSHWHSIIPPIDPDLPFPPDPSACADVGMCFHYTVEHARDPTFVDSLADPYAGVAMDWVQDSGSNFPRCEGLPGMLVGELEWIGRDRR
ncbi:unnamed protein product [Rhizoctonia solani]|uniref:Zn(2)-C6 fungal-type domain-containing protein n=1 Tax=Rhizoctonia solani TaxID=456999 RepID=A0A8H2Y1K4_9AGAM|nr:unnamed protein product [Rhizoctonia solani]